MLERWFVKIVERLDPARRTRDALAELRLERGPFHVVAIGKASAAMARGAAEVLGSRLLDGVVVAPKALPPVSLPPRLTPLNAAHPVPDARSEEAGRLLLAAVRSSRAEILALVSGGASALIAVPAPGITLAEKVAVTDAVKASGADIGALNTVRKHLSAIKGGRLAAAAAHPVTTVVASDVVGDSLSAVGSGPTVPDPTTLEVARHIIEERLGWSNVPPAVRAHLVRDDAETPSAMRAGDRAVLASGIATLLEVAAEVTTGTIFAAPFTEPVVEVGARIRDFVRDAAPGCYVGGGEPTIALPSRPGLGGRAQQLALWLARELAGVDVRVLVAGTDGIDGNSQAAGAIIDGHTWSRIDAGESALERCDAGSALASVGAVLCTGPTGVNHADLILIDKS